MFGGLHMCILNAARCRKFLEDLPSAARRGIVLARFSGGVPNNKLDFGGIAISRP